MRSHKQNLHLHLCVCLRIWLVYAKPTLDFSLSCFCPSGNKKMLRARAAGKEVNEKSRETADVTHICIYLRYTHTHTTYIWPTWSNFVEHTFFFEKGAAMNAFHSSANMWCVNIHTKHTRYTTRCHNTHIYIYIYTLEFVCELMECWRDQQFRLRIWVTVRRPDENIQTLNRGGELKFDNFILNINSKRNEIHIDNNIIIVSIYSSRMRLAIFARMQLSWKMNRTHLPYLMIYTSFAPRLRCILLI